MTLLYAAGGDIVREPGMRSMIADRVKLWPNGRVPYSISRKFNKEHRAIIALAIKPIHDQTCVRLVRKEFQDRAWIHIESGKGCWAHIGRTGRKQNLSIEIPGCVEIGIVQHELMHSLGFYHEQNRYDRNQYVKFFPENASPGSEYVFGLIPKYLMNPLGEKYDVHSLMHYNSWAYSKNGKPTMLTLDGGKIPYMYHANPNDFKKINRLYNCPPKKRP